MKNNKKGFTLAELLIVVAIIAVLVAIAIPIFTSQLEKAREATDAANLRSAYAEVMVSALTADSATPITVDQKQKVAGWTSGTAVSFPSNMSVKTPDGAGTAWTVSIDTSAESVYAQ